jgi:hypothetical protein
MAHFNNTHPVRGRFPYATLYMYRTEEFPKVIAYIERLSGISRNEAIQYANDVVRTEGRPSILDLIVKDDLNKREGR